MINYKDNSASDSVIKSNHLAIAVLLDVAYHIRRENSKIITDLGLKGKQSEVIEQLNSNGFIRPNPHKNVKDVKYVLTTKGYFLVNELKVKNPKLMENITPKLVTAWLE